MFEILQKHRLCLNVEKCSFGVGAGKFLGYLITSRGIEVNPNQIEAVKRLRSLSNPKEVQVLTGVLASLNRFISKIFGSLPSILSAFKEVEGILVG